MSYADEVREHCRKQYVAPARSAGQATVTIRAGDVHSALGYTNRMPLVCSAIGAKTFEATCQVKRLTVEGPLNGANTTFTFSVS